VLRRLCFYINLPLGAITIGTVIFVYHASNEHKVVLHGWREYLKSFDPTGNLVLIPAVICLFLALQWGGTTYAWSEGRIIALFVVFGILIAIFIFLQFWNKENAMIPPKLLKVRSIWAAVAFNFFIAASFFILAYVHLTSFTITRENISFEVNHFHLEQQLTFWCL